MYQDAQYVQLYGQNTGIKVTINGNVSFVPLEPANTDYRNMMALVAAGELVIAPAEVRE